MRDELTRRHRAATTDSDAGVGTLEYVGIVTLAAILVAALVLAMTTFQYGPRVQQALCELTSLGQGECGDIDAGQRPAEDYVPDDACVVGADGQAAQVKAGVLLTGGAGGDWLIEEMGDGTFRLTRAANLTGGVAVGIGFDVSATVDNHAYGAGAQADASADIVFGGGEVFYAGSREEAEAILTARNIDTVKDSVVGGDGPARWLVDQVHDVVGDTSKENTVPDETFIEGGMQIEGSAGVTATIVNAGAEAQVKQMLGVTQRKDGTLTAYYATEAKLSGSVQTITPGAVQDTVKYGELSGTLAGSAIIEVDYDDDGKVTNVRVRSAYTVDGTNEQVYNSPTGIDDPNVVHEVTANLPITNDSDRAIALRMLQSASIPYVPGLSDSFDVGGYVEARVGIMDATADFYQASAATGQVWRQTTTEDTSTDGFNFDAAYIAKLEVSADTTTTRRSLTGYDYFNGQGFVPRPGCGAGVS